MSEVRLRLWAPEDARKFPFVSSTIVNGDKITLVVRGTDEQLRNLQETIEREFAEDIKVIRE